MSKKVDPIERALDAYFQLDESQRRVFQAAVRHVYRYAGTTSNDPVPAPTRGRPKGSKNRKADPSLGATGKAYEALQDVELVDKLFGNNGAAAEGL